MAPAMSDTPEETHYPVETQLALIRRDLEEIRVALHGDGTGKSGLIARVQALAEMADRGRWVFRSVLWLGGGLVALLTAAAQVRTAWLALRGHGP
jgi:hypothetical protein